MIKSLNHNNKYFHKKSNLMEDQKGFTLIEMAIVLLIGGVLISFMGSALLTLNKKSQINKTEFHLEKIHSAMKQYFKINGRYPCAAPFNAAPDDLLYGREVTANCNTAAGAAANVTVRNTGVRIGAVPTRTLNLPDEFMADAWGNKLTYAVTEDLATDGSFTPVGGRVIVRDINGNSLVEPANTGHYIIVSHGATGRGAYAVSGSPAPSVACNAVAGARDIENCNNNRIFISTLITSDVNGGNFYDDYVLFEGQTVPFLEIPTGAIMAFNTATCPDKWSEYEDTTVPVGDPGRFPARGRFVVGSQAANKTVQKYTRPIPGTPIPPYNWDLSTGTSAEGNADSNIPPYVALLYCRKD